VGRAGGRRGKVRAGHAVVSESLDRARITTPLRVATPRRAAHRGSEPASEAGPGS
jgi:hypothetical protein